MTHVISLVSSKGGCGKTTTALNLGVAFAERGRRVVVVDLDPQGAVGLALDRPDGEWPGLAEHVIEGRPVAGLVVETRLPGFCLLPRGRLDPVDTCSYEAFLHSSGKVREVVRELSAGRDYVLLDTPSGVGAISRAALAASDWALLPLQAEPLALRSIGQALRVIEHVSREENRDLRLLGILPTMVQVRDEASFNVLRTAWARLGGVLESVVPRAPVFLRASEAGLPVSFLAGRVTPEARRFEQIVIELETLIAESAGGGEVDERPQRDLL
ncbi:MAG TPA: ParA family protein [Thermoanaerobaculia bacterium]|nr:ParA family protein [Thermoanaerobaculia bacterium]HQN06013.1 ParA family protein [Thermoanaerobaculia bacterium]HQP85038.1 ParA family protein [Thermoanaerobaculia bacterium]